MKTTQADSSLPTPEPAGTTDDLTDTVVIRLRQAAKAADQQFVASFLPSPAKGRPGHGLGAYEFDNIDTEILARVIDRMDFEEGA